MRSALRWATLETVEMGGYLLPATFTLELVNEGTDEPDLYADFEVRAGRVECRQLRMVSHDDGREVTSADCRAVRVEDFLELAVRTAALPVAGKDGNSISIGPPDDGRGAVETARNGRRRVSDTKLREVAKIYSENIDGKPTQAVADHLGVVHRTATLWVKRARDAGLLPPRKGRT